MSTLQPIVHLVADEEAKKQAKEIFEQIKNSTGKVPKWMRVMANCEDYQRGSACSAISIALMTL